MTKRQIISTVQELDVLEVAVTRSAERAAESLLQLLQSKSPIAVLRSAKFETIGTDPLADRPLNLIEQINQTFTYLASFEAVRHLLRVHPDHAPYHVNLGNVNGQDISSSDGQVVAEVFAAVRPSNNRKLLNDVEKVASVTALHRYVFYSCAAEAPGTIASVRNHPEVGIVSLGSCGPA